MKTCELCEEKTHTLRLRKIEGENKWLCLDCAGYKNPVAAFKARRQPRAWVTDDKGVEFGVDKHGIIPHEEDPYYGDKHGWNYTGKVKKKKIYIT